MQLIVSDEPVLYPYLTKPDILVVMSQDANERYGKDLKPGGLLLYEQDLIQPGAAQPRNTHLRHSRHTFRGRVGPQASTQYGDGGLRHRHDRTGFPGSSAQGHQLLPCPAGPNP